ncbi:MAG TPA: response regulator [Bacillota bacterium]|nr:response regulator [Bacillota bacterium]
MDQIKIGLVEDDQEWQKTITNLIHQFQDLWIVWSAGAIKEAKKMINSTEVDIVIADFNLTGGLDFTRVFAANKKVKTKVIMISELHDEILIAQAFLSGAVNYIFKENIDELPEVIRSVATKKPAYEVLIKYYQQTHHELLLSRLTPSEKEVYLLKEKGRNIRQIALATQKAEGTVKNQLSRAGKKLRTANQFLD